MKRTLALAVALSTVAALVALPAWAVSLEPDASFGTDGVQRLSLRWGGISAVRADGSQLVGAGRFAGAHGKSRIFVTRVDEDGSPDPSFGVDGVASARARGFGGVDLEVLGDGSVLTADNREDGIAVRRWTPAGDRDTSFSSDGIRLVSSSDGRFYPWAQLSVDTQGRIVVAGMTRTPNGTNALVARLMPGGAYDDSLSDNGRVTINLGTVDAVDALATDANDRILLGSDYYNPDAKDFPDYGVVIRLRGNGSFDTNFSGNGVVRFRMREGAVSWPVEFGVADSGVITVAAIASGAYGAVRLLPDGSFDTSYGHDGIVSFNCTCDLYRASIDAGRVAFVGNQGWDAQSREFDWTTVVARIGSDGVRIDRNHLDLIQGVNRDDVNAVLIDGARTVIGGEVPGGPFMARLS